MVTDAPEIATLKDRACAFVDSLVEELIAISHSIHAQPELGFEERHAHRLLTEAIARYAPDAALEPHACGLETAFVAHAGVSGPTVGVVCEYDALPGIGHAVVTTSLLQPVSAPDSRWRRWPTRSDVG